VPREIDGRSWLTAAEAAERARVTVHTIYRLVKEEPFACRKLRRGTRYIWLIEEESFEEYITSPPPEEAD